VHGDHKLLKRFIHQILYCTLCRVTVGAPTTLIVYSFPRWSCVSSLCTIPSRKLLVDYNNQDISSRNTSSECDRSVSNFLLVPRFSTALFRDATSFNQDCSSWDTSNVQEMNGMFNNATSYKTRHFLVEYILCDRHDNMWNALWSHFIQPKFPLGILSSLQYIIIDIHLMLLTISLKCFGWY
jgi:surface protein